jgi:hypothetical protein
VLDGPNGLHLELLAEPMLVQMPMLHACEGGNAHERANQVRASSPCVVNSTRANSTAHLTRNLECVWLGMWDDGRGYQCTGEVVRPLMVAVLQALCDTV